jgi:O-antigen ligase
MAGIEIKSEFVDLTKSQGLSRLYSVMANPNNDAEFWVMLLPFSIASAFITKSDVKRLFIGGMIVICLAALMLTYSRAGYIALMGAAGIFILLTAPRLVPVCILLFIMLIPFIPSSIVDRLLTVGKDTSSKYRFFIWEGSINMVKDYWVQGIGMGPSAFSTIYRGYANRSALNAMHAHNVLLNVWVETGIGGFIALLAYLIKTLKAGVSAFYHGEDKLVKFYSAAAVSSFGAFFIFSMVEYVWYYPRVMLCFWLISAMAFSLHKINGGKRA